MGRCCVDGNPSRRRQVYSQKERQRGLYRSLLSVSHLDAGQKKRMLSLTYFCNKHSLESARWLPAFLYCTYIDILPYYIVHTSTVVEAINLRDLKLSNDRVTCSLCLCSGTMFQTRPYGGASQTFYIIQTLYRQIWFVDNAIGMNINCLEKRSQQWRTFPIPT